MMGARENRNKVLVLLVGGCDLQLARFARSVMLPQSADVECRFGGLRAVSHGTDTL